MMDFICFSINNWEKRRARKQQFMLHLALRDDTGKVLYIEPALNLWRIIFLPFQLGDKEIRNRWFRAIFFSAQNASESRKLYIFTSLFIIPFSFHFQWVYNFNLFIFFLSVSLKLKLLGIHRPVLWLYHPFDYPLLRWFKNRVLSVFDWAEEWAEYFIEQGPGKKQLIRGFEEKIIRDSDVVFVVSAYLLAKAKKINPNTYRILDGTAYKESLRKQQDIPQDLKGIKKPIAGYLGTINHRVDSELLEYLSIQLPYISIVMIGDVHYKLVDFNRLKQCKNIYFLGAKEYEELSSYAVYFDVSILPYIPEMTLSFPTKVMDYLAIGKPIVSTDLIELNFFKEYIYIARSKEEFPDLIKKALEEGDPNHCIKRKEIARNNTWSKRAEEIVNIINERLKK